MFERCHVCERYFVFEPCRVCEPCHMCELCLVFQLESLQAEADRLEEDKPDEAEAIRDKIAEINNVWVNLKDMVRPTHIMWRRLCHTSLTFVTHFIFWERKTVRSYGNLSNITIGLTGVFMSY